MYAPLSFTREHSNRGRLGAALLRVACAGAALTASTACWSTVSSEDVRNADLRADIIVSNDGFFSTSAYATLREGTEESTAYIELTGEDRIFAAHDTQDVQMEKSDFLGIVNYYANLEAAVENAVVEVRFERAVDMSPLTSRATMPSSFTLLEPISNHRQSRSDDLAVSWTPEGAEDEMLVRLTGTCITTFEESVDDARGAFTLEGGTLEPADPEAPNEACDVTVTLERSRPGTLADGFGQGGRVDAKQTRASFITLDP